MRDEMSAMSVGDSMVLAMSETGKIVYANHRFEVFCGRPAAMLVGQPYTSLGMSLDKMPLKAICERAAQGEVWRGEVMILNAAGQLTLCHAIVCPVLDGAGDWKAGPGEAVSLRRDLVVILDDVARDKDVEKQFLELKKLLSEQEKLATIGSMLTGIIHEINNPLSYIDTNVLALEDVLKDMNLPDSPDMLELKDMIKDIKTGVAHIKGISASLKRMAFKGLHEEEEYFDVNEEVETVLNVAKNEYKYYAFMAFDKGQSLFISGYPSGIRQVVLNLIINATHAVRKKYEHALGHISVKTYKEGGSVVIEVSDDGAGIPEAIRGEIFEPFFTTKKRGEGTGLGLSISKGIVEEKHGGSLSFSSVVGEGTTFWVRLPERREVE